MNDTISRQAAIDALEKHEKSKGHNYTLFVDIVAECEEIIRDLPSAEREKGKWVKMTGMMPPEYFWHYECSECGWHLSHHDKTKENELRFCPNCGASMMDANATQHKECVGNALDALDEVEE